MTHEFPHTRRSFLVAAALGATATELARVNDAHARGGRPSTSARALTPVRQIRAGVLDVGYYEGGPSDGPPVLLLHGFPYAIDSFAEVAPVLAARGCRVIVPHLRGHGSTRFLDDATPRAGQQAAIGVDVVALMDALRLERAVLAGYDWGGRAACVVAALWPERCAGLVSVNGYLIQDIAAAARPLAPAVESGLWYQFYFATERGRAGLTANRREVARTIWLRNSPTWRFDEATLDRHARAFDAPTTWRWCSTRTAIAWGSPTGTRRMRTSSGGSRRCRASPRRRSRWTARRTEWCRPPTAVRRPRASAASASTA
jgi:pimeloyl-ACP methyl ester carboxylesterase